MKQVILNIPNRHYSFFMRLIKSLTFVQVAEEKAVPEENDLSSSQQKTWHNIKQGFEELKLVEQGKLKARPASEFLAELEKEGLL